MLQSLIITSICIFGVQTFEVYDEKYSLSTTGSPEHVNSLEDAQNKCVDSWILEIYDENVATLLKKLNVNIQQNEILLGMKRDTNSWRWSDGTNFKGHIYDQSEETRVVACIGMINNQFEFFARTVFDSAFVICSRISTKDKCSEWFYNGLCYFKPTSTTTYKWFEAHNECIKYGASMATFNNSETNFNMSFIDQMYWDSLNRNTWIWTHAGEAVTFNKWLSGQPVFNGNICAMTNSDGNKWKVVDCIGKYHIVCMRENQPKSTTTQPYSSPGTNNNKNVIATTSKYKPFEDSLSSGAKAGIGVGVSMLLIIIIIIVGVLGFKYIHHFKTKSQSEIKSQDIYEKPDFNNSQNHIYQGLETK